jgi:hypothetical protein
MPIWSPHSIHYLSQSEFHLRFAIFVSRPARCRYCRHRSFRFELGYLRAAIARLRSFVPLGIEAISEAAYRHLFCTIYYFRLFCENPHCEFEDELIPRITAFRLSLFLLDFLALLRECESPLLTCFESEIFRAVVENAVLFFGPHCHERDSLPSVIIEAEFALSLSGSESDSESGIV